MKKWLSVLLVLTMLFAPMLAVQQVRAAEPVKPVLRVGKWNGTTFSEAEDFKSGDLVMVKVSFNQSIMSLASLKLQLDFSTEYLSYVGGSFSPELVAGSLIAGDPILNVEDGKITVFWGKSGVIAGGTSEFLGGSAATSIASFVLHCDAGTGSTEIKATIDNAMSADYSEVAMSVRTVKKTINITNWELHKSHEQVFLKLEQISYNPAGDTSLPEDSLQYIRQADAIYNAYTPVEKLQFADKYPELFQWYQTALTRYYDEGMKADRAQIQAAAEAYRQAYESVYNLSTEQIDKSNYLSVQEAIKKWNELDKNSPQVTLLLLDEKAKLDVLEPVVTALANQLQADSDAKEWFIDRYANTLWNATVDSVDQNTYGEYLAEIAVAESDYDFLDHEHLSSGVKSEVETYYEFLQELKKTAERIRDEVGEDAAIQKEIEAFTEKWHSVMRLNVMTAGVKDITALELYLKEFGQLSETAQTRLSGRKNAVEQLLAYVKGLDEIANGAGNTGGVAVVPQGGNTDVKEVVKEVEVESLVTQIKNKTVLRNVPDIVFVAVLLMGISVLTLPVSFVIIRKRKRL